MININGQDLTLELTRWCNMECWHCLRGDRQRGRMPKPVIDAALRQFENIGTLTFTGGEPTLALDLIEYTLESARYSGIAVGNIHMTTNGSCASERFKRAWLAWLRYCDDNSISALRISRDQYHEKNDRNFYELRYWWTEKVEPIYHAILDEQGALNPAFLLSSGRAEGMTNNEVAPDWSFWRGVGSDIWAEHLIMYVNIRGDLLTTCNASYARQKEFKVGTVHDNWSEIAETYARNLRMKIP